MKSRRQLFSLFPGLARMHSDRFIFTWQVLVHQLLFECAVEGNKGPATAGAIYCIGFGECGIFAI